MNLSCFYGDDSSYISLCIDDVLLAKSNKSFQLEVINLEKKDDMNLFLNLTPNLSLFSNTVILKINLQGKLIKYIEEDISLFIDQIKNLLKLKEIIISVHYSFMDSNTKKQIKDSIFYKSLSKLGKLKECFEIKSWQMDLLEERIRNYSVKKGIKFKDDALKMFIQCFKDESHLVYQEINKLCLYVLPENIVTVDVINKFYSSSMNIDDLFKCLISSEVKDIINKLNFLKNNQSVLYILAAMQNKLRMSLKIKYFLENNYSLQDISILIGINQFILKKEVELVKSVSVEKLKILCDELNRLEFNLKSGTISDKFALDILLVSSKK